MKLSKGNIIVLIVLVVVIIIAAFATLTTSPKGENGVAVKDNEVLLGSDPDSPYTDLDGNPVALSEFKGKVLVVNAWASWCPFCVNELPDFNELGKEYQGQDVVVLAINRRESQNTAKAFVEHVGTPEHITFLLDSTDNFYKTIGGFSMPETLFFDREGNLSFHKRGFMTLEEMRSHTETAIRGINDGA